MLTIPPYEIDYDRLYGDLPNDQEKLINIVMQRYAISIDDIREDIERIQNIEWRSKEFIANLVPRGTPRPRGGIGHVYVKGAADLKKHFTKFLYENRIICTRCKYYLEAYFPTPISTMSKKEIVLAEMGLIAMISNPDFDNTLKTYTDCLQGVLLLNDNLIADGQIKMYYSIKPRIKVRIEWQADFDCDFNKRKIMKSIAYKKAHQ